MNGIGLSSTVDGLKTFLQRADSSLRPGGTLIFDSSDIAYMYDDVLPDDRYYGEVRCRYQYGTKLTDWFSWLYIDQTKLIGVAAEMGWHTEIVMEDGSHQFLAMLRRS